MSGAPGGPPRRPGLGRLAVFAVLALLYLLHNDVWLWRSARQVGGLPVGLVYHVGYCVAVSVVMAVLVRVAWPDGLSGED